MEKDIDIFHRLLYEEASDILIFRPHEYKFDGALIMEKGELLRDIVSAANTWRRADTYILVGVEATSGGKNKILGIINHLDEKKIQEFVNDKLQETIQFSYVHLTVERKKIGMIHIPLQKRPYYLKDDFANLKKYVIYIRRGNTIREADTEEAALIKEGQPESQPSDMSFQVEFARPGTKKTLGGYLKLNTYSIEIPTPVDLPDFAFSDKSQKSDPGYGFGINQRINPHYYRELALHLKMIGSVEQIDFCITNTGSVTARDVQLDINIEDPDRECFCLEEFEIPTHPVEYAGPSNLKPFLSYISDRIRVKWRSPFWNIRLSFRDIPPGKAVFSEAGLYIGAVSALKLELVGLIKARGLSSPFHAPLVIDIQTQNMKLDRKVICKSG